MFKKIANELGVKPKLFPLNEGLLQCILKALRKEFIADRIMKSLRVDISKAENKLGWVPKYTMVYSIKKAVKNC